MSQPEKPQNREAGRAVEAESALWNLIPLSEFKPPAGAAPEAVRSGLHDLWQRLRGSGPHRDGTETDLEMDRPSQKLLDWAAPQPDWAAEEMTGLESSLHSWLVVGATKAGVQTIVEAPLAIVRERLERWAVGQGYSLLPPPTPEQILRVDPDWLNALPLGSGQRLFLPRLERCFLRHHNGLDLLRRLIEQIDRLQPDLLLVCQSWAWRYLCQVEQIDAVLGAPLTPASFGDAELNRWLCGAAEKSSPYDLVFREASTGKTVLDTLHQSHSDDPNRSSFLKHLAARSRGNPRVAWDIWRRSLLTAKDSTVEKEAEEAAAGDKGYTLWVRPWDEVQLPDLVGGTTPLDGMVLYALLQHGGLPQAILADLLPAAISQVVYSLYQLRRAGLVQTESDEWQPTPAGYPAVRRFLAEEGFLVDDL